MGDHLYRVCSFCVMDTSIPSIKFDAAGQCNCCSDALRREPHEWWPNTSGKQRLNSLAQRLKAQGKNRKYDALIGLSGGIDSAYLAHLAVRKLDLRVLAVHVDGGWNSAAAVRNIESLVRRLDLDLYTFVVEWQEMRDIQVAFLRASVFNQDIPQDHAFFSTLHRVAVREGLKHFLSGVNFASESIQPPDWGHSYTDAKHIAAIHDRFGDGPRQHFPLMGLLEFLWHTRVSKKLVVHRPLNFIRYEKNAAEAELRREYGWQDYGGKHHESRFTKFYQEIYLPRKFGFDKRRLHLSSLIVSGQITREHALRDLQVPLHSEEQESRDLKFVAKKLGVKVGALENLIKKPAISHLNYPNHAGLNSTLLRVRDTLRAVKAWMSRPNLADHRAVVNDLPQRGNRAGPPYDSGSGATATDFPRQE